MFNNGAISAEYAIKKLGLRRVAIVDVRCANLPLRSRGVFASCLPAG